MVWEEKEKMRCRYGSAHHTCILNLLLLSSECKKSIWKKRKKNEKMRKRGGEIEQGKNLIQVASRPPKLYPYVNPIH